MTQGSENKKYRTQIASSAGVVVFAGDRSDHAGWVEVSCQRLALRATALVLKHAFIKQPVEVPQVRRQFASFLGLGPARFGPTFRLRSRTAEIAAASGPAGDGLMAVVAAAPDSA
jgi:hypothetical protein